MKFSQKKKVDTEFIRNSWTLDEFIEFVESEKIICDEEFWGEMYMLFWTVFLGVDVSFLDHKRLS